MTKVFDAFTSEGADMEVIIYYTSILLSWVDNNGLKMNVRKIQAMFLGRRGRKNEVEHASLTHQGVTLTAEPKVKFLGVIVDKDLNWSDHVTRIRRKC